MENLPLKFEEGQEYPFTVTGQIILPDAPYFIIRDESGGKYLLRADYYTNYDIEDGKTIFCRIDKINCNGKIFMEPRHPVYKPGDKVKFVISGKEDRVRRKDKSTYKIIKAITTDNFPAIMPDEDKDITYSQGQVVDGTIVRIKKGELWFIPDEG